MRQEEWTVQYTRASSVELNCTGNSGRYLGLLKSARANELSFDVRGCERQEVMLKSANFNAIGFEGMADRSTISETHES